jgi:threonyl-tRNA synthetase
MDRNEPYNLHVELARGRLMRISQKREDWGLFDFDEGESLSKRIALAHERAIPFVIVVGAREVAAGEGALRSVGEPQRSLPVAELAAELARRVARPPLWDDP